MNFWEDNYRVEEDGSIFSLLSNKYLKPWTNNNGYIQIKLSVDYKVKSMLVHRLVALTYIPNEENRPEVDHIDRDKTNNHFTNLRWVSRVENMQNLNFGESGKRNIGFNRGNYRIQFGRNKLVYLKILPKTCTMQQIINQRDLMLSMF
tara:strand:- start:75 stop:518 length:444 start_codon:yes stop_codon:yes gene_type:complete